MSTISSIGYMCLSVRGAISNLKRSRRRMSGFQDDTGKPLSRTEAIAELTKELASGNEVIPMHKGCDNPCRNNCKCAGFDYKGGGCPGYEVTEEESA